MTKAINVGVIGVGVMGERHCRVYSNLRHVRLVGVADQRVERGKTVAANYESRYFENYRDLLAEVDAVSIVTITPAHFELALAALEAGVDVLVEKPLTETVEQGKRLVQTAEEGGRILQVGHIERFNPAYIELKNVVSRMKLIAINIRRLSPFDTSNTDVDVVRDLMIHDLDLIVNLVNKDIESLNALGRSIFTKAIDHAVVNLSFQDGPIGSLCASRITEQKVRAIEVIAEGAYVEADLLGKSLLIHKRTLPEYFGPELYRQESMISRIHVPTAEPLMLELQDFITCVRERQPCQVPGRHGLYALQLAEAIDDQIRKLEVLDLRMPQPVYRNGV
jgi:predicted dehydrogenase